MKDRAFLKEIMLEDVLDREGVEYRVGHGSSGEQLNIETCPFCGGSEWKVYANRDEGLGNCFHGSCGETFNIVTFTNAILEAPTYSRTFQYLEKLASDMGWRPRNRTPLKTETEDNEEWSLPENFTLPMSDDQNLAYLLKRQVDNEITKYFDLRFCIDGWFNYTKPDGERGGMFFGNRVIVPVYDLDGTMVTFQGRDLSGESDRKYLFPPGLPGTGRYLFNGQNVVGKKSVIMCEGAFDVIRTWSNIRDSSFSDYGVIGSFGIHLSHGADSNDQKGKLLQLKAKGLREVIMFWDGEEKAFKKALKAAEVVRKLGLTVRIARPPEGLDPGDLSVEQTSKALREAVVVNRMSALRLQMGTKVH